MFPGPSREAGLTSHSTAKSASLLLLRLSAAASQRGLWPRPAQVSLRSELFAVTIWELVLLWALGASVAVTVAMLVALAIIFWINRKLD